MLSNAQKQKNYRNRIRNQKILDILNELQILNKRLGRLLKQGEKIE